jgi:polyisoprenoid-binding protein YceI
MAGNSTMADDGTPSRLADAVFRAGMGGDPGERYSFASFFKGSMMLRSTVFAALAVFVALPVSAQDISKDPSRAPNGTYRLDVSHSQLLFSIAHLGLTDYYGRFDKLSGTLSFDANQPEKSAADITISTDSVDTPSQRLNDELKSTNVFSTTQFPSASFKSTSVTRTGADTGRITGELTIKGITKPVILDAIFKGGVQNPLNSNYTLGFHATAVIKRKDFGLTGMIWEPLVSDDVNLVVEAMFEQEKE